MAAGAGQSCLVLPLAFLACFQARTCWSASGESMSATDRGWSSENGAAASYQPAGRLPSRLARMATRILAFSSP